VEGKHGLGADLIGQDEWRKNELNFLIPALFSEVNLISLMPVFF
jgi:hypothetical protein